MEISEFESLSRDCFENLFKKAKKKNEKQFLTSFFAFYKINKKWILDYITNYVFGEVIDVINTFNIFQADEKTNLKIKTRVRLLIYCYITEAKLLYMIIFNMIRTIKGFEYSTLIYTKKNTGKNKELIYPYDKINKIIKETTDIGLDFESIFAEIYYNNLRNAFSHAQYFLDNDANLILSQHLSPTTSGIFKHPNKKTSFKYIEIENIFNKTLKYVQVFIEIYEKFLSEYKDGNSYPIIFGKIKYDKEFRRWLI